MIRDILLYGLDVNYLLMDSDPKWHDSCCTLRIKTKEVALISVCDLNEFIKNQNLINQY